MKYKVTIQEETCIGCGLCSEVCSRKILKTDHRRVNVVDYPDWECCQCGLCMSICPTQAIRIEGADYADFGALAENEVDFDILEGMLSSRRSIRSFKDRSVERHVLDKVIQASAMSPIGSPPTNVQVLLVDKSEHLHELYQDTIRCWEELIQSMRNPIYRFVIRRVVGANRYHSLTSHALPAARIYCEYAANGRDVFTFHAPAVVLFHGHKLGVCVVENCWLAASYATIAAHSLGLGSVFSGMIPPIINMNADVKHRLDIPDENDVHSCLMMGYPDVNFKRRIPRKHKEVRYLSDLFSSQ